MSLSAFQQALAGLQTDARQVIERAFDAWSADARLSQVSQNVADETALANADFTSLLDSFATLVANGETPLRPGIYSQAKLKH